MLREKQKQALWIARTLFDRGRTAGAAGNISFLHDGDMYITARGTCFGTLKKTDFVRMSMNGAIRSGRSPSKEWPLHLELYNNKPRCRAVIHTHSTYSILWSCVPGLKEEDCIPEYTPYLKMRVGTIGLIPYEAPGSKELFDAFSVRIPGSDGYILKRHGAVVCGKDLMDAYFGIEELEESAKIAFLLRQGGQIDESYARKDFDNTPFLR